MNCYEIALPDSRNGSTRSNDYAYQRSQWEAEAVRLAGGYTVLGVRFGTWRHQNYGELYEEAMHWYRVACDQSVMDILVDYAFTLFKDQEAIFVAKIGTAVILENPTLVRT